MRPERLPAEHVTECVQDADVVETDEGAEARGTLVQRWIESGEAAAEQPVRVAFAIADGLISRIELAPAG